MQKTLLKLVHWFQRYEQLKNAKNNRKQKTFSALFGSILKSTFLTSNWFCLITSHTTDKICMQRLFTHVYSILYTSYSIFHIVIHRTMTESCLHNCCINEMMSFSYIHLTYRNHNYLRFQIMILSSVKECDIMRKSA